MEIKERPVDVLHEYLILNGYPVVQETKTLRDIFIGQNMLYREYSDTCTVWYLRGQGYFRIPGIYLQLFRSLDTYCGERLLYREIKGLGKLDLFIVGFLRFVRGLEVTSGVDLEDLFQTLAKLGTTGFREYLRETESLGDPGPWVYEEPQKTLEL